MYFCWEKYRLHTFSLENFVLADGSLYRYMAVKQSNIYSIFEIVTVYRHTVPPRTIYLCSALPYHRMSSLHFVLVTYEPFQDYLILSYLIDKIFFSVLTHKDKSTLF